mgnify:CR=1 FL=1
MRTGLTRHANPGSPPRMRGKALRFHATTGRTWITPAHAGKNAGTAHFPPVAWDHPRTCGEKLMPCPISDDLAGSPPHMRGKAHLRLDQQRVQGITPAHVGKRHIRRRDSPGQRDHPRTYGEKSAGLYRGLLNLGSPPHMRGKVLHQALGNLFRGITPAHAGKRVLPGAIVPDARDHPRTCGEKL